MESDAREMTSVPSVAVVARDEEDFGVLAKSKFWPILHRDPNQRVWTDDYSNVAGALLRKLQKQRATDVE